MTPRQEAHLKKLKREIVRRLDRKYRDGAKAHKGDLLGLSRLALVDEALAETIDLSVYLLCLRFNLAESKGT